MLKQSKVIDNIKTKCDCIMNEIKAKTCCFTGHRPQKLSWLFDKDDERYLLLKNKIRNAILNSINLGYQFFISGMALGFDTISAEIVLDLKKIYPHIQLECALPCKNQQKFWREEDKKRYRSILKKSNKISLISKVYTSTCMVDRNIYMVNNSSALIALFDGKPGGTKKTLDYAKVKGLKIINLMDD